MRLLLIYHIYPRFIWIDGKTFTINVINCNYVVLPRTILAVFVEFQYCGIHAGVAGSGTRVSTKRSNNEQCESPAKFCGAATLAHKEISMKTSNRIDSQIGANSSIEDTLFVETTPL